MRDRRSSCVVWYSRLSLAEGRVGRTARCRPLSCSTQTPVPSRHDRPQKAHGPSYQVAYNSVQRPTMEFLAASLLELITQTSTNLPPDVRAAMSLAANQETPATQSSQALDIILSNVDMAVEDEGPICQDTGMPTFVVHTPVGVNQIRIKKAIHGAIAEATRRGKLRPNSVDSLSGKNSGNNLGEETPVIHFEQWERDQ